MPNDTPPQDQDRALSAANARGLYAVLDRFAGRVTAHAADAEDEQLRKRLTVVAAVAETPAGVAWGLMYLLGGEPVAALVPLAFAPATGLNLVFLGLTRRFAAFRVTQVAATIVLPRQIAQELKSRGRSEAKHFDDAGILFADVVGSTQLAATLPPQRMVQVLDEVFSHFDGLVAKYGLEKMSTAGDNYMVASGVPAPRPDHAQALARMALEMNAWLLARPPSAEPLRFRIGMNSGPAVAGVIGHTKFHYDIWGDAVNTASRMESHGVPGKIQITREAHTLLQDGFICVPRGEIEVKGKGMMAVWFLEGERPR